MKIVLGSLLINKVRYHLLQPTVFPWAGSPTRTTHTTETVLPPTAHGIRTQVERKVHRNKHTIISSSWGQVLLNGNYLNMPGIQFPTSAIDKAAIKRQCEPLASIVPQWILQPRPILRTEPTIGPAPNTLCANNTNCYQFYPRWLFFFKSSQRTDCRRGVSRPTSNYGCPKQSKERWNPGGFEQHSTHTINTSQSAATWEQFQNFQFKIHAIKTNQTEDEWRRKIVMANRIAQHKPAFANWMQLQKNY